MATLGDTQITASIQLMRWTRWTKEQLHEYEQRRAARKRHGTCPGVQEQQVAVQREVDNQTGIQEVDGGVRPEFRVSVDLFYANKRRRDGDGAATTLADCIVTARRRLLDEA